MADFDPKQHRVIGDAKAARLWIKDSNLPDDQKPLLLTFVNKFEKLTFVKEDDALLDHTAKKAGVTIPAWFREIRKTVAFVEPTVRASLSDYEQYRSPRSDDVEELTYDIWIGYINDEQRELLRDKSQVLPIGGLWDSDRSYLAIDLKDPSNTEILEFALEDLMDNDYDGWPVRGSLYPIFSSYAQFLAHIAAVEMPDGTKIKAS